ncbi:MAG: hypothetical protein K9M02_13795 [Thiohalocapsa sp.]|nr:hypothetical protein [Thiohalocapsa sp.]
MAPGWLVLRTWRLRDVRFFAVDADTGAVLASSEAGQRVPIAEHVIHTPEAIFPLTLAPKQRVLTVVRIQDKTFPVVSVRLHDPDARVTEQQHRHDLAVTLLGFVLAIVLVLLVQGDSRYAVVASWLGGTAITELTFCAVCAHPSETGRCRLS